MYEGEFRELNRGWVRIGPSVLETGSERAVWAGFRAHLVSDHQRTLFDLWLAKCAGHRLPERSDFSHRDVLSMIHSFYTSEYDMSAKSEVHRYVGSDYAEAIGYELTGGAFEQTHFDALGYSDEERDWLMRVIYERGCPSLERYQFLDFDKPHLGCIDLTLPVRRAGSDDLGEAIGVGFLYDAKSAPSLDPDTGR